MFFVYSDCAPSGTETPVSTSFPTAPSTTSIFFPVLLLVVLLHCLLLLLLLLSVILVSSCFLMSVISVGQKNTGF